MCSTRAGARGRRRASFREAGAGKLAEQAGVWNAEVVYLDFNTGKPATSKGTSIRKQPLGALWQPATACCVRLKRGGACGTRHGRVAGGGRV